MISLNPDSRILGLLEYLNEAGKGSSINPIQNMGSKLGAGVFDALVTPQEYGEPIISDTGQSQGVLNLGKSLLPKDGSRQSMFLPYGYDKQGDFEFAIPTATRASLEGLLGFAGEYDKAYNSVEGDIEINRETGAVSPYTTDEAGLVANGLVEILTGGAASPKPAGNALLGAGGGARAGKISGYHVTHGNDWENFDINKTSPTSRFGQAMYIAPSQKKANMVAKIYDKKGVDGTRIMPVDVELKNPYIVTDESKLPVVARMDSNAWSKSLQEQGYDGVILKKEDGSIFEVAVFDPKRVSSSIGNTGDILNAGGKGIGLLNAGSKVARTLLGDVPLEGVPQPKNVPNYGAVDIGGNPKAQQAAIDHSKKSGILYTPVDEYAPIDKDFAARVANEYELMPHDPQNPRVREAYTQMRDEMYGQYEEMLRQGVDVKFDPNPYSENPWEALADLHQNNRLLVYPTKDGFGTDALFDPKDNPLLGVSPFKIGGEEALDNDIFRAVHDWQGHAKNGFGFRGRGEDNAYLSHSGTFSPLANKALATETRGQNSWLNYGRYGEHNRTASVLDTKFADQKTGLLPNWVVEKGTANQKQRQELWDGLVSAHRTGMEGALNPDGTITLIHRTPATIKDGRVDPAYYGRNLSGQTRQERQRALDPDFVPRTFWGVDANVNPYKAEGGLGENKYIAKVNGADIYDAKKDPKKLWNNNNPTKSEKEIWKSGHSGYIVDHPKLGKIVQLFDPVNADKKLMIPLVGFGSAGLLTEQDPQPKGILEN